MGKLRWYKRDPVAALEGMSNLSLEEVGAYNIVLDLIYARDGQVDDDDRFIAGWLRVDVRVWRRIRARLLACGKLYSERGALRNLRADREVSRGLSMVASASEAGKTSARKRNGATKENKEIASTTVEAPVSTNSTTTTTSRTLSPRESERAPEKGGVEEPPKAKRARARTPLAEDWVPDRREIEFALSRGFLHAQIDPMGRAFRNYHVAKGNLMANWFAAWQSWCDNEIKFQRSNTHGSGRSRSLQDDERSASRATDRLLERVERENITSFPPRPSLLPKDGKEDVQLLPPRRGSGP